MAGSKIVERAACAVGMILHAPGGLICALRLSVSSSHIESAMLSERDMTRDHRNWNGNTRTRILFQIYCQASFCVTSRHSLMYRDITKMVTTLKKDSCDTSKVGLPGLLNFLNIPVVLTLIVSCFFNPAYATANHERWAVAAYAGVGSTSIVSSIFLNGSFVVTSAMAGVVVNARLCNLIGPVSLETEFNVSTFFAGNDYRTAGMGIGLHVKDFPLSNQSIAIFTGPSYADRPPAIYYADNGKPHHGDTRLRWLNFVSIEWVAPLPQIEAWNFVLFLHHRSGAFGFISNAVNEDNGVGIGLQKRF